jgi:hypothetical protein
MELVSIFRQLWRRKLAFSVVVLVAALLATMTAYKLPSMKPRSLALGAASSQILIDSPASTLVQGADSAALVTLSTRATIYAQYLSSLEARSNIAAATGIPAAQIIAHGPFSADTGHANYQNQSSESRANDVTAEKTPYRLVFDAQEGVPIITVSAQAPTPRAAVNLAEGAYKALRHYIRQLKLQSVAVNNSNSPEAIARRQAAAAGNLPAEAADVGVVVRELGAPEGGQIGGSNSKILMFAVFLLVTGLGSMLLVTAPSVARQWRLLDRVEAMTEVEAIALAQPAASEERRPRRSLARHLGRDPDSRRIEESVHDEEAAEPTVSSR